MKKIGFIINPIAGVGGRVGLKGSDGEEIQKKAFEMGAKAEAPNRGYSALCELASIKNDLVIYTAPGIMGEDTAVRAGFNPNVVGRLEGSETSSEDTVKIAAEMLSLGLDLIMFAGGDGTARNIYQAVNDKVPVLGIPAGVKIHSAVYAVNPKGAGKAALDFLTKPGIRIKEAEVMDIDEDAFRTGVVQARLYGYMCVPEMKRYMQNCKAGGYSEKNTLTEIAAHVVFQMKPDEYYIIGPGTTTRAVMENLGLPNTLLGVDVVKDKQLIASDVTESELFSIIDGNKANIIITVIGGQGHIFGRGNQQLSPRILRQVGRDNINIIATKEKLVSLFPAPLLVDTGDEELNQSLCGYIRVLTGLEEHTIYQVSC